MFAPLKWLTALLQIIICPCATVSYMSVIETYKFDCKSISIELPPPQLWMLCTERLSPWFHITFNCHVWLMSQGLKCSVCESCLCLKTWDKGCTEIHWVSAAYLYCIFTKQLHPWAAFSISVVFTTYSSYFCIYWHLVKLQLDNSFAKCKTGIKDWWGSFSLSVDTTVETKLLVKRCPISCLKNCL